MARILTPQDAHEIMNALVQQATGQSALAVTDTSSFVSAGESVMATGVENTLNALSLVLLRNMIALRPYQAKFANINNINTGVYAHRLRKISYLSDPALPAGDWNTQLYTNLEEGFDNGRNETSSTASMWEQHPATPLEMNFAGSSVWQDAITRYEYQVKQAFRDESTFNEFVAGFMTEKGNAIERQKEAFSRMAVLNFMAGLYDLGGDRVVNLTAAFNTEFGGTATTQQLLTTRFTEFLEFLVSTIQFYSDRMTHSTTSYHWSPTRSDGKVLLRHTPKDRQKLMLYNPLMINARARVLPAIFNDDYLKIENYEGIDYWQSFNTPAAINITPAVIGTNGVQMSGNAVNLTNVVGMLFDEDALMIDFQLDEAATTPLEARKHYSTVWYSMARNAINDFSENAILFYMADK